MYADHFKFSGLPFQLTADPRFYFRSSVHQKAMAYLQYGLEQREGFIVVTGEIGAGKTTIVGYLLDALDPRMYVAARVVTTQLEANDLLRLVAAAFGVQQEGADKATLLHRIEQFLLSIHSQGKRAVLVVDEAQNLTVAALEELRMLSNFQIRQDTLLQSFLLGQPQFRNTLARPELEQLRQRIIASYHLGPLSAPETVEYIEHRLRTVGWNGVPGFAPDAYAEIHRESGGVPRRINSLCSRLLLSCFLEGSDRIDGNTVRQVASELASEFLGPNGVVATENEPVLPTPQPVVVPELVRVETSGAALERIEERLAGIEERLDRHDRLIKQSFAVAADYFDRTR